MTDVELETTETPADRRRDPSTLPVLPLKETVVFPDSATPLAIGQERSIALIDEVVARDGMLALVAKDSEVEQPGWDDLNEIGTAAMVHKLIKVPDGTLRILVQGLQRTSAGVRVQEEPYLVGEFSELPDVESDSKEVEALTRNVQMLFGRIVGLVPYLPAELEPRRCQRRRSERALAPHRLDPALEDRREAAAARGAGRREAAARALGDPEPRARGFRAGHEDPVARSNRSSRGSRSTSCASS